MCYVFYGDDLSYIVWNNFNYDGCFSACSYTFCEYLNFLKYDVGFVVCGELVTN